MKQPERHKVWISYKFFMSSDVKDCRVYTHTKWVSALLVQLRWAMSEPLYVGRVMTMPTFYYGLLNSICFEIVN